MQAPGAGLFAGAAFDREGTLFVQDYTYDNGNGVASITGGCKATAFQFNSFPGGSAPDGDGSLKFSSEDNIDYQVGNSDVLTFAHPQGGAFGDPIEITVLDTGNKFMDFLCLTNDGKHLWASSTTSGPSKSLREYAYRGGGKPILTIPISDAGSCAAGPALVP